MPLLYYRSLKNAEVALWKATEKTSFFKNNLLEQEFPLDAGTNIKHREKAHQWFASRYLLCSIYPAAIQLYSDQKPFLFNGPEISFSHTRDVVAVMISKYKSGIDAQWVTEKLIKIAPRYVNQGELELIGAPLEKTALSLLWSIKEAVFKSYGTNLPFKDIELRSFNPLSDIAEARVMRRGIEKIHRLHVELLDGLSLAYLIE